eukprot:1161725-Pelagomonas_calceolata.AAC.3
MKHGCVPLMDTKALERQRNRQDLNRYIEISIFEKVSIEGVVWCAARLYGYLGSSLAVSGRSEHMHEHEQPGGSPSEYTKAFSSYGPSENNDDVRIMPQLVAPGANEQLLECAVHSLLHQ